MTLGEADLTVDDDREREKSRRFLAWIHGGWCHAHWMEAQKE